MQRNIILLVATAFFFVSAYVLADNPQVKHKPQQKNLEFWAINYTDETFVAYTDAYLGRDHQDYVYPDSNPDFRTDTTNSLSSPCGHGLTINMFDAGMCFAQITAKVEKCYNTDAYANIIIYAKNNIDMNASTGLDDINVDYTSNCGTIPSR